MKLNEEDELYLEAYRNLCCQQAVLSVLGVGCAATFGAQAWLHLRDQAIDDALKRAVRHRKKRLGLVYTGLKLLEGAILGLGLDRFTIQNDIQLSRIEVCNPKIPAAFDGYRILWIGDLHMDVGNQRGRLTRALCDVVGGTKPDLLVFGGDYRHGYGADLTPREERVFKEVARIHRAVEADESAALLGNHDIAKMLSYFVQLGVRPLVNNALNIKRHGACINLFGADDADKFFPDLAADILKAGVVPGCFNVLLVHSPHLAEQAAEAGYDAYLIGHTHGGQVRYPAHLQWFRRYIYGDKPRRNGQWSHGEMRGYTDAGVGVTSLPFRNIPGETTEFTLRSRAPDPAPV